MGASRGQLLQVGAETPRPLPSPAARRERAAREIHRKQAMAAMACGNDMPFVVVQKAETDCVSLTDGVQDACNAPELCWAPSPPRMVGEKVVGAQCPLLWGKLWIAVQDEPRK